MIDREAATLFIWAGGAKLLLRILKGVGIAHTVRSRQVSPTGPGYKTKGAESGFGKHMSIRSAPCEALTFDCQIK